MTMAQSEAVSGCRLAVLLTPRASVTAVTGWQGEELKIKISAPPVDGAANAELIKYLASWLKLSRASISIASGHSGRRKILKIEGLSGQQLRELIEARLN